MSAEYRLHLLRLARSYRMRGHLHPLIIIEGAEETLFLDVGRVWGDHDVRKTLMYQLGGTIGFGIDAQRLYALVDVWVSMLESAPDETEEQARARADGIVPSQDPNRRQALQCIEVPKEGAEEISWQPYTSHKHSLKFEKPVSWDHSFEDFTFGYFWQALRLSESASVGLMKAFGAESSTVFQDSGMSADSHARRAARTLAFKRFGTILFGEDELARRARRWGKP